AAVPHIVVPAAELARRMPPGIGIALNPGAEASVPISPEGVGYLAAAVVIAEGTQVRVGRPPADPVPLLSEVRSALAAIEQAVQHGPGQEFPIDVTFPGEGEPDQVDTWITAHADPFYIRA